MKTSLRLFTSLMMLFMGISVQAQQPKKSLNRNELPPHTLVASSYGTGYFTSRKSYNYLEAEEIKW